MAKRRSRAGANEPILPFDQPEVELPPHDLAEPTPPEPVDTPAVVPTELEKPTKAATPATDRLTKLQRKALDLTKSRLISASAGTGKTHVLTALYLALLEGRLSPGGTFIRDRAEWLHRFASGEIQPMRASSIVAVTFTRKAAAELLDRARVDLERELSSSDLPPALAAHLRQCREELPGAPVSTIDAFCARLLREAGARSPAPAGFTILDEAQVAEMLDRAFRDTASALLESDDHPHFKTLAREWGVLGAWGVVGTGMQLFSALRSQGREAGELRQYFPKPLSLDQARAAVQKFGTAAQSIKANYPKLKALKELCATVPLSSLDEIRRSVLILSAAVPDKVAWADPLRPTPFPEICNALHLPFAEELAGYVEAAARRFAQAKLREGGVDFDDLLFFTRELLNSDPPPSLPYKFVMIDEYQDTNPLQDEVLQAVAAHAQSKIENPKSKIALAVVGDPKQSIYGFRGADVSLIKSAKRKMDMSPLKESFRSRRVLIDFFNEFFNHLWPDPLAKDLIDGNWAPFIYSAEHTLEPSGETERHSDLSLPGEILSAGDLETGNAEQNRWHQALAIARRIRTLVQPHDPTQLPRPKVWSKERGAFAERIGYGDFAILSRTIKHLRVPLQLALSRMGIPFRMLGGLSFYSRQEVIDVMNLLATVADPRDNLALAGLLRSPFAGLSDAQIWQLVMKDGKPAYNVFEQLRLSEHKETFALVSDLHALLGQLTASEIIDRACVRTGYLSVLALQPQGEISVAAVRRLIEVSRAFESRKAPQLSDFVNYLREKADAEWNDPGAEGGPDLAANLPTQTDAVQIGTIHSAKGLEFPIVVLADIGAGSPNLGSRAFFHAGNGMGLGIKMGLEQEGLSAIADSIHESIGERQKWAEGEESKRLLYVALTRAREYVILVGEKNRERSWRTIFDEFCGNEKHKGRLSEIPYRHPELMSAAPDSPSGMLDFRRSDPASDRPVAVLRAPAENVSIPKIQEPTGKLLQRNIRVSVSQLAHWLSCPRREAFDRWLTDRSPGIPPGHGLPDEDGPDEDADPDSRALGTAAHAALEAVFSDPEIEFDSAWNDALLQSKLDSANPACSSTRQTLVKLLTSDWGKRVRALPPERRLTEKPFRMTITADPATSSTITVVGKLDLLVALSDSNWQIVDYKLAERPKKANESTLRYAWQTLLYASVASQILRKSPAEIEPTLMFLRDESPKPLTLAELGFAKTRLSDDFSHALIAAWRSLSQLGDDDRKSEVWMPGAAQATPRTRDLCAGERCPHLDRCFKT
jgi:ATP-dependent helicase/nuclease subunit A